MPSLENVSEQQDAEKVSTSMLSGELLDPAVNKQIVLAKGIDQAASVRLEQPQQEENEHVQVVRELTEQIAQAQALHKDDDLSEMLKMYIKERLDTEGINAADRLGSEISGVLKALKEQTDDKDLKEMLDGMKLEIKPDANLEASEKLLAQRRGKPVPEYIRSMQLVDKNGKVLGDQIDIRMDNIVRDIAIRLATGDQFLINQKVTPGSVGKEVGDLWLQRLAVGGPQVADKLGADISKVMSTLPGGRQLIITDDPDVRKQSEQDARAQGREVPDFVRLVQLIGPNKEVLGVYTLATNKIEPQKKRRHLT